MAAPKDSLQRQPYEKFAEGEEEGADGVRERRQNRIDTERGPEEEWC